MIRLNLLGAMGNQLFEYAFARALSEEFGDSDIRINDHFDGFIRLYSDKKFYYTSPDIKYLTLNENVSFIKNDLKNKAATLFQLADYVYFHQDMLRGQFTPEKFMRQSARGKYQQAKGLLYTYYPHNKTAPEKKLVTDLFQSEKYFKSIENILRRELLVKAPPSPENRAMIEEMSSCESVAVHIRRGDFGDSHWSFLQVCNERYYQDSMDYIAARVKSPVFYIFSNNSGEIQWIKENYHFDHPVKYVDMKNPAHEDYRLMYNCRNFVISNSTFSWWGSYMSKNPSKIITAPDIWQKKEYKGGSMDIYRDDMIKIKVYLEENDL